MRSGRPWHLYLLALLAVAVAVLAATSVGAPGRSIRVARETVTAEDGVVQSTVTGTGNVAAGTDLEVNFQTSGTLQTIGVSVGQHVNQGQLLATLDQTSAQLAVNQAQESLTAAEDQLTAVENGTANGSSGSSGGQTASLTRSGAESTEFVTLVKPPAKKRTKPKASKPAPATPAPPARSSVTTATRTTATTPARTTTTTTPSPASIASAQAAVYSAEANLHNAQQALIKTNLYAPASGTIVSLASLSPGDPVAAGNAGAAGGGSASGSGGSGAGSSSSSAGGGGSSSSTPFARIVDASTLTMTVAFSESDISKVAVSQSAVITMDALSGLELAAHVSSISTVGTTTNGVVSYDATLTLDQTDPRVKPGMSASASVITGQASGVTVPNQAVSGTGSVATVDLLQNGKAEPRQVIVGLRGSSRTQILSGLSAGQQLVVTITLPSLSTSSSSTTPGTGTLGRGFGGGGGGLGGGGGGGLGGGGFRAIFGGGPGGGG